MLKSHLGMISLVLRHGIGIANIRMKTLNRIFPETQEELMSDNSSAISLTEVRCPACGAPLSLPDGVENIFCTYCGVGLHVGYSSDKEATQQSGMEPDGTIRDRATGMGLFKVKVPDGWKVVSATVEQTATSSQPLLPKAILACGDGTMMEIALGEAGDRLDGATKALLAMGGQHLAGIDRTNYAEMPDPFELEQRLATERARQAGLAIRKANGYEQPPMERLEGVRQAVIKGSRAMTQQAGGMVVEDAMCCEVIQTYDAEVDGRPWGMATAVRLVATRYSLGGMGSQVNDMMSGFGNMMRGIFGGGTPLPRTGDGGSGNDPDVPPRQQLGGTLRDAGTFIMGGGLIGKMMREQQGRQVPSQGGFGGLGGTTQQGRETSSHPTGQQAWANAQMTGRQGPVPSLDEDDFEDWVPPVTDAGWERMVPKPPAGQGGQADSTSTPTTPGNHPGSQSGGTGRQPQGGQVVFSVPDLTQFDHGNLSWEVSVMAVMIAPKEAFDREYERTFLPMLGASGVHPDVKSYKRRALLEQQGQNQQATNAAIMRNQQMTQATLAAARERNAAFQSYNDAWSARSDAQHASFRAASNARFSGSPSGAGGAGDFSEAIRGVNTFVTSDGREVELSVASDVAYENRAGDVVGGTRGFDPGADWTQIQRK